MDQSYSEYYEKLYFNHWWWRARERSILRRIEHRFAGRSDLRILDIGCGNGLLFKEMSRFGKIEGVEGNGSIVLPSNPFKSSIHIGSLEDAPLADKSYDLFLLLDVIEHIDDDYGTLRRVRELAKPGATVLITVPAMMCMWTTHDDINFHKRRYTKLGLSKLLTSLGFQIDELNYFFVTLGIPKLLLHFLEKVTRPSKDAAVLPLIPPEPINSIARQYFELEDRLLPPKLRFFGSSLLAILKIPG
jgi:SAM-dependent methyltransferase